MITAPRRKAATNLSLRADLVARAKELEINISQLVERALEAAILERERAAWLEANERGVEAYNARVAERGVFSDGWRSF